MASFIMVSHGCAAGSSLWGTTTYPATRGPQSNKHQVALSKQRLSTDSIGTYTLTLTNVVIDSVIRVETQAGSTVENRTAASTTEVFSVPAYVAGNASNDLRIKVRKGTASTFYKPYETLATAVVGSNSIYVSQILD